MAFNPFDVFRRNQRILFSVLTVFIMFMFVLSYGQGDLFDWLPRYIGSKSRGGDKVATLNGSGVYETDLYRVDSRRLLANGYMFGAATEAAGNLTKYLNEKLATVTPDKKPAIQQLLQARQTGYVSQQLMQQFQFAQMGFMPAPGSDEILTDRDRTVAVLLNQLATVATASDSKEDDREAARAAQYLLDLDTYLAGPEAGQRFYFSNQPNRGARDQVDFLLWLRKADELGIVYTRADLNRLIAGEFWNRLSAEEFNNARNALNRRGGFTDDELYAALNDEFRVRAAQVAVMGQSAVRGGPLSKLPDAPYDYYQFYKDQTSSARFGVVSVPVENFVPQVTAKPTEGDLLAVFKKYRNTEPNPMLPAPGLRDPRKLKLGYLEAKGDEPFYKTAADKALPEIEANLKALVALTPALGGPSVAHALAAVGVLREADTQLQGAYQQSQQQFRRDLESEFYVKPALPYSSVQVIDTSVTKPQNLAAAAGAFAGSFLTAGTPLTAGLVFETVAAAADRQARAAALAPLLVPGASVADRLGAVAGHLARVPQPPPLDVVRPALAAKVKEALAQKLAQLDLEKFQKDLAELGKKLGGAEDDKKPVARAEAQAAVEKFVKERGLKSGASTAFHDQYSMGSDDGLKALRDKAAGPHGGAADLIQFGRRFFFEADPFNRTAPPKPAEGLYVPQPYPFTSLSLANGEAAFLVWRTDEQAAESPRDLNAPGVRERTEAAWRKLKARDLAKKAVEELAKACDKLGDSPTTVTQKLMDQKAEFAAKFGDAGKDRVKYHEIADVAPLANRALPMAGREMVTPFQLAPSADIPFPTGQMTADLLTTRQKPLSTSVAMVDQPEDRYYVATLLSKQERSPEEFGLTVYGSPLAMDLGLAVSRRHQGELSRAARDQAVALLKEEFRYGNENAAALDRRGDSAAD